MLRFVIYATYLVNAFDGILVKQLYCLGRVQPGIVSTKVLPGILYQQKQHLPYI